MSFKAHEKEIFKMTNHHSTPLFRELLAHMLIMGVSSLLPIIVGRILDSNNLLVLMAGGLLAGSFLCLRLHIEIAKMHEQNRKKAMQLRGMAINKWCNDLHHSDLPDWAVNRQIAAAKMRASEELQVYFY